MNGLPMKKYLNNLIRNYMIRLIMKKYKKLSIYGNFY